MTRSEERWRAVFENCSIGLALADLDGRDVAANSAFQKMPDYAEEELRQTTLQHLTVGRPIPCDEGGG